MADNVAIKDAADASQTIATTEIGGVDFQKVIVCATDGTAVSPPASGTAGTANANVLSVQGIASMTPVQVADNGGALTVDGTVAATQSGTWNVTNISGTVSLPTGAATAANQSTTNTNLGATTNAAVTSDANGSAIAFLRGIVKILATVWKNVTGSYYALQVTAVDSAGAPVYAVADPADDAAFTAGTSKVAPIGGFADESSTDSVDEGDVGAVRMTLDRKLLVNPQPHTAGGCTIFRSIDLDESEEEVKASAGQVYGWYIANLATSIRYVKFYNATAANTTVGTTTPVLTFPIPANSTNGVGANVLGAHGIAFNTAITVAATTGVADNNTGAPGANEVVINLFYK